MPVKSWLLVIALFIVGTAAAQDANALLWKISGKGLNQPSYLYGTAHLLCDAALDAKTTAAIGKTEQLYLEIDMDDPSINAQMMSLMMMKDGVTISSLLSKEDYLILDQSLQSKVGTSLSLFNSVRPMVLTAFFFPSLMNCSPASVEQLIMSQAMSHQHEVYGLETVAEQFEAFDVIPYAKQLEELMKAVKSDFAEEQVTLQKLFALYKAQDIQGLLQLSMEDPTTSGQDDVLLKDRNHRWVPKIKRIVSDKPTFFAVGAAHLAGADGVISLLKREGYTVTAE